MVPNSNARARAKRGALSSVASESARGGVDADSRGRIARTHGERRPRVALDPRLAPLRARQVSPCKRPILRTSLLPFGDRAGGKWTWRTAPGRRLCAHCAGSPPPPPARPSRTCLPTTPCPAAAPPFSDPPHAPQPHHGLVLATATASRRQGRRSRSSGRGACDVGCLWCVPSPVPSPFRPASKSAQPCPRRARA